MFPNTFRRGAFAALLLCASTARAQQADTPTTATPTASDAAPSTSPAVTPPQSVPTDTPILAPETASGSATPGTATPGTATPVLTPNLNQNTSAPVILSGAATNGSATNGRVGNGGVATRASVNRARQRRGTNAGVSRAGVANTGVAVAATKNEGVAAATAAGATPNPPVAATKNEVAAPKPPAFPARGTLKIEGDTENLSVFAVSVDAAELLTAIAAKASLKLVVDDTISRRITLSVQGKSAREVISSIAGAYGLAAAEVEGVTLISEGIPRTPSSYLLSDIDQISTKYVDAANARNLLPVFLQDYVKVNGQQNAVVLSAPAEVLRKFRADIAGFDIPASQIMVDLLLVELTESGLDQLNLSLNYQNSGNALSISPSSGSVTYRALTKLPDTFASTLSALQETGRARVRANPRIATVSGRHASIFVGRQRYIVTPIDTGGGQRNFIDAGVRLDITPYTGGEKQIIIDVNAEVSTLSAVDPVTRLPEKSTRTTDTKVRVSDGQTIVIGGLKQSETRDVETKVPILGNLPLLGPLLFRSRDKRNTNTELVLFVTPRILSDTGHLPEQEEKDIKRRFLTPDLSAPLPAAPLIETMPRFKEAAPLPDMPPVTRALTPDPAPAEAK
ncbi:type II and III secretion system protein [Abditibacterium utsteinense]|uniref:Type II and III secretion system protein n=1 Tax=Abditibacterium utsteinense TaxID=1960156 RepID=A0A2S8SQU4_9BACT|nr:hypothetical protein [Abditibacterium utsteinense]PQV63158.1 type II and III secretion system protein [Abditibacterium utsteinense]